VGHFERRRGGGCDGCGNDGGGWDGGVVTSGSRGLESGSL